jgi:hypothetical protein
MVYRHKDDCLMFPMDIDLKKMMADVSKHKNNVSEKLGWEFVSQATLRQAPMLEGQPGYLVWVISFRKDAEDDTPDIPVDQIPLSGM